LKRAPKGEKGKGLIPQRKACRRKISSKREREGDLGKKIKKKWATTPGDLGGKRLRVGTKKTRWRNVGPK